MVKLQDFARLQGVTDRQVQRLLHKYASELEGHVDRRGHNGTWLSDEACEILRGKMKQAPVVVADSSVLEENARLRQQLDDANAAFQKYASETAAMLIKASEQISLAERSEANQRRAELLEAQNGDLRAERDQARADASAAAEKAQKASQRLTEAEEEIRRMKEASFWQRLKGWK